MKKHLLSLFIASVATVMTLNARTVLIDEGFENGIQESVWTQEYVVGETPWAVESVDDGLQFPSTVFQGSHRAYLRNTTGETQGFVTRLVSKVMDLSPRKVYQPELTFWYANPRWTSDRDTLRVLYRTSPNAQWKRLAEYSNGAAMWQKVNMALPEVGPTYQIAFEGKDNLGHGIVLDSVLLRSAPECTVPHDLFISNKGANRVNVAWAASWDANQFEIVISRDTINLDSLDVLSEDVIVYHTFVEGMRMNSDFVLEADMSYLVYVRSICGSEISAWSSRPGTGEPYGFTVYPTEQVPYSCSFTVPKEKKNDQWIDTWHYGNNMGTRNPYMNSKVTSSTTLGYYSYNKSTSLIFSGGTNASTPISAGNYVFATTPALADTTNNDFHLNQCQVHFWSTVYIYTGRQYGRSLIVGVMDNPEDITTFKPVDTVSVWGNKTFQENIVSLASYRGTGAYVAFVSDFDRPNLFYIDDVTIEYRPQVNKVTTITVNPRDTYADISWEGNASSYNVLITNDEVDPSNPAQDAIVDQATVTTNSYRCTELEADHSWNAPYYVYVQAEGTDWSYRYPFVTIASKREIPYTFDFESASGRYKLGSTYYIKSLGIFGNNSAYPYQASENYYLGANCLYLNKTAGTDSWVTFPMVDDIDSVQIKFYLSGLNTYNQAHAQVGVMTNPMDINTFVPVADFTLNTSGYSMCYANFENYSGSKDGVIAISWGDVMNMGMNTINYIDNVTIEKLSDCVPPTNIQLNPEATSVNVTWDASKADTWEVIITKAALTSLQKEQSFAQLAALGTVAYADTVYWNGANNPTFNFDNLKSQMSYYFYVRTLCGGERAWWTEIPFVTPCPNYEFPYKETFENYISGSTSIGCWQTKDYLGNGYPMIYNTSSGAKSLELYSTGTTHRSVAIMPTIEGNLSDMMLCFETRSYSSYSASVLYVGTMGDINDQNSFVPFDTILNTSNGTTTKVRLKLEDYNLAYDNIAFSSGLGVLKMSSDVLVDNIELKDPNCIDPYDFVQTQSHEDAFEITWSGESYNDRWEVKVLTIDASLNNNRIGSYSATDAVWNDTVIIGKTLQVTNLQPLTTYYVYVRGLCGDSIWAKTSAETSCQRLDPSRANKETFDRYPSGTYYNSRYQADCWTSGNLYRYAESYYLPYICNNSTYASSGTNSYRLNADYEEDYWGYSSDILEGPAYLVTPEIKCDSLSEVAVTFSCSGTYSSSVIIGVMTNPNDFSTFVALDSLRAPSSPTTITLDLSEYGYAPLIPASARYIAWRTPYDNYAYVYIDDVSITSLACPLTKPDVSDVTFNTARVSSGLRVTDVEWVLLVTSSYVSVDNLSDSNYVIPASSIIYLDTLSTRTQVIGGLEPQTTYYVATAAMCDSVVSLWNTMAFRTPCRAQTPEEMGTITFSSAQGYSTGTSGYMPCWTVGTRSASATSSYIPYINNSVPHNGHNYVQLVDDVTSDHSYVGAYAIMPELDVDNISRYQVSFWGRGSSSTYYSYNSQVIVGVISDPSDLSTFVALDTVNMTQSVWEPFEVAFDEYDGDYLGRMGRSIMFLSDFGITNYAYITDISIDTIPACRAIATFSVDSVGENAAIVSWKGHQNSYRLLVADRQLTDEQKPAYHYLIDSVVNHSNRVRIDNLKSATTYYIYAQGICDGEDRTDISYRYAFVRTECPQTAGVSLPFSDDFESYDSGDRAPGCWIFTNENNSSYPVVQSLSSTGTKAVELYSDNSSYGGSHAVMVVPKLANNLIDLQLSFDARGYSSYYASTLYIGTMSDPEDPTTFDLIRTINLPSTGFAHYTMNLADYDLMHEYLAFTSGLASMNLSSSVDIYVDNVTLEVLSTCHPPKLTASNISYDGFTVNIAPNNAAHTAWDLVIVPDSVYTRFSDFNVYLDTTRNIVSVSDLQVPFSSLSPATGYCVFARTLCGGEEGNSTWSKEPLRINTRFYYKDEFFFGFEKSELWERSINSSSNNYYIHPALETGRDTLGAATDSYSYYPYSIANNSYSLFSHTGTGALNMYGSNSYYGGYVIFPAVETTEDRSFEFKIRPGYISASTYRASATYDGILEIGLVDKNRGFANYENLATVRLDALGPDDVALEENDFLFHSFSLDLSAETLADKQVVMLLPQQPSTTVSLYLDNVKMGEPKGYSLVSIRKIEAEGDRATIEWDNIGGPWNLVVTTLDQEGNPQVVASYNELTATSIVVENLLPRTSYMATLSAVLTDGKGYELSTHLAFETSCLAKEPDQNGAFVWNFDSDWEANDILQGAASDTAYLKPACFTVGINYATPNNGSQWLVQRKGFEYYNTLGNYDSNRHVEVGRNDSHALRSYSNSNTNMSFIVLPELHCGYDTMMIEFYGRCFANYDDTHANAANRGMMVGASYLGAAYSHSIVVGTLDNPYDFSSLKVIDTLTYRQTNLGATTKVANDPSGLRYWELMQLPLTEAEGKYIVLFQPGQGLFFIDDLAVKPIGNTIFMPGSALTASVDGTSATLSWKPRHPDFESVVVLLNAEGVEIMRDTVVASTHVLTGLTPATNYSWFVYQTNEGVNSVATPAISFITECAAVAINYTSGFELKDGWQIVKGQTSDAYKQTLCWTYGDAQRASWTASNDPYNQPNTDYYQYSRTDSFALFMKASYSTYATPYQPYVAMPQMDINAYDTLQVTFWMRPAYIRRATGNVAAAYTGASYSKSIIVGTMTDPADASTFVAIDTVTYDGTLTTSDVATEANNYLFRKKKVDLAGATGPYVAFMTSFHEKGSSVLKTGDNIWLDDVEIIRAQDCKDPKDLRLEAIASTAATLSWDDRGLASDYRIQVSTDPYFADDDLMVLDREIHSNPFTVTGLEPMTTYAWRVQSLCGGDKGESEFSSIASFTTGRSPFFVEHFETSSLDKDWLISTNKAEQVLDSAVALAAGNNPRGFRRLTTSYGLKTPHYAAPGYSGDYNWAVTPSFYLPLEDSVHLSLDIALTALNTARSITNFAVNENDMADDYYFMIVVSDDGGATWKSANILDKWQNTNPEGKQLRDIPADGMSLRYSLAQYAGKNVRIGFYREAVTSVNTGIAVHMDNIRLAYYNKTAERTSACQYEDVQVGDIYLSGEDTKPGVHSYPTPVYVTDEEAMAGTKDMVYAIEIEVHPSPETVLVETVCEGDTYSGYDFQPKDRSGIYRRKLTSAHHCDSIVTLHLTVVPKLSGEVTEAQICPGEPYWWHGQEYDRAGLFRDTLISSLGCDSIESLVITYSNSSMDTIRAASTIDESELPFSYIDFSHMYTPGQAPIYYAIGTPPGVYVDTVSVYGEACNTVLIHTLTILKSEGIDLTGEPDARGAQKIIFRDRMYIILNDEWYNAAGQKVPDPRK